jgi:hypothetical protein
VSLFSLYNNNKPVHYHFQAVFIWKVLCSVIVYLLFLFLFLLKILDASKRGERGDFDWVIFLGGTNDLGWGKSPVEIYAAIKSITSLPLENGARVLLMTVPECAVRSKSLDSKRDELNGMIREREGV